MQSEVRRHKPDVVALQECEDDAPLDALSKDYVFLGARQGHVAEAGYVHLYARGSLEPAPSAALPAGVPGVSGTVRLRDRSVAVVALHLAAGRHAAAARRA